MIVQNTVIPLNNNKDYWFHALDRSNEAPLTSEVDSLQYQLMQSIVALDREESAQKALEAELNEAQQELLTASDVYRGSNCQAVTQASQDLLDLHAKVKLLQLVDQYEKSKVVKFSLMIQITFSTYFVI